jgi:translation initiation factor 1A
MVKKVSEEELEIIRTRIPKENEVLGFVEMMLGASRLKVICEDGKTRICRIPGRLRRRVWIRVNDVVLIQPWKVQSDERGDVVHKYTPTQARWLKRKGFIKSLPIE